jgi:hypothetical protein
MYPKNRYNETKIDKFSFDILFALALTTILSILTSSFGWMTVLFFMYVVPVFVFISFALIAIAFGIKYFAHKPLVWVDKYFVYPMIYIQVFITIFNFGECIGAGSSIRNGNFIQRIIHGILLRQVECSQDMSPWIRDEIIIGLYALNLFILVVFIIRTLASSHSRSV